jgi:hypothetical protein
MIKPRQLAPLLLALMLGSGSLLAQPAPDAKAGESTTRAAEKTAPTPSAQPAPATREQAQKSTPPKTGKDSPFDYRSSEQISEDVPVSFPVDI